MVLYTIVPPEIIFSGNGGSSTNGYNAFKSVEIEYYGEKVMANVLSDDSMVIDRVISSNFRSYLHPALQPGMAVDVARISKK